MKPKRSLYPVVSQDPNWSQKRMAAHKRHAEAENVFLLEYLGLSQEEVDAKTVSAVDLLWPASDSEWPNQGAIGVR